VDPLNVIGGPQVKTYDIEKVLSIFLKYLKRVTNREIKVVKNKIAKNLALKK